MKKKDFHYEKYCQIKLQIHITSHKNRTVDNHRNTEIMETVIFVKCRDFAKMP